MFLTALLHLRIPDTKIHTSYLESIYIYMYRIKESAELCIQFCILPVFRRFCTIRLLMARKRVSAFCTLLIRVVRVQNTALCERAVNTRWALSQHSRMLDMYIFLAFLYIYALTCIKNNQIEPNNLLYNPAHD
jgi:hypothetical protein